MTKIGEFGNEISDLRVFVKKQEIENWNKRNLFSQYLKIPKKVSFLQKAEQIKNTKISF